MNPATREGSILVPGRRLESVRMRHRRNCLTLLVCICAFRVVAQEPLSTSLALTHVNVVRVQDGGIDADMTVIASHGDIIAVESSSTQSPPEDARVIDATGKYLIPALWDMHVHLRAGDAEVPDLDEAQLSALVATGIMGVRDMGSDIAPLLQWRAATAAGNLIAPRILTGGSILDGPGSFEAEWRIQVADSARAQDSVDAMLASGADFIKVHDWLSPEVYLAIADRAREIEATLVGHIPVAVESELMLKSGHRSIEHLGNIYGGVLLLTSSIEAELRQELLAHQRESLDSVIEYAFSVDFLSRLFDSHDGAKATALFEQMADAKVWHVPTLGLHYANSQGRADAEGVSSDARAAGLLSRLYDKQLQIVTAMRDAGVPFMAGSDNWWVDDPTSEATIHKELQHFVSAGFSTLEALQTATLNPARFLGIEATTGTVEPGKVANLVVLDSNPLVNIEHVNEVDAVIYVGRLIEDAQINELREQGRLTEDKD